MNESVEPIWLYTIIATAMVTMLGYLCKLIIDWISKLRVASRERKSKLIELHSLLLATKVAYTEQCRHRNALFDELSAKYKDISTNTEGYDQFFAHVFEKMNEEEKEIHLLIRAITENTLRPLNRLILQWLQSDVYFKSKVWSKRRMLSHLSKKLRTLEAHLYLWEAKFLIWIPGRPERSLVFLADENNHGIAYPKGIEETVEAILERKRLFL
jgi:hypothetical protein